MNIEQLKALIDSEELHHVTYRNMGTLWEGLWVYRKANNSLGFAVAGCFNRRENQRELGRAEEVLRSIQVGVNVGYLGNG